MNRKQRILNLLTKNFNDFKVNVKDNSYLHSGHSNFDGEGETHIQILLSSQNNKKLNRLQIHKKINNILKDEYSTGLHSLEIKIK